MNRKRGKKERNRCREKLLCQFFFHGGLKLEKGCKSRTLLRRNCPSLIAILHSVNRCAHLQLQMSRRHSINRPPTPDAPDDDDDARAKEPTLHEIVSVKLIESGEKERLMELVRERLVECGWKDEMRTLCRAFVKKNGRDNVTVDDLVRAITPKGRASIPDSVKAELLQKIRTFLVSVAH